MAAYPQLSPFGAAGRVQRRIKFRVSKNSHLWTPEGCQKQGRDAIILLLRVRQDYTSRADKASTRTKISMTGPFDCSLAYPQPTRLGQTGCWTNDTKLTADRHDQSRKWSKKISRGHWKLDGSMAEAREKGAVGAARARSSSCDGEVWMLDMSNVANWVTKFIKLVWPVAVAVSEI